MSGEAKDKIREPGFTNALWNLLQPFQVGGKGIMGVGTYVAIETIVGQTIRRVMKAPYNIGESIELHTYSVPFLGPLNFGEEYKAYPATKDSKVDLSDELAEGAKAIPAAVVGYIAMKLRREGIKIPGFANRDFVYMVLGKIMSRPLTAYLYQSLPEDVEIGLTIINDLANRQKRLVEVIRDSKRGSKEEDDL